MKPESQEDGVGPSFSELCYAAASGTSVTSVPFPRPAQYATHSAMQVVMIIDSCIGQVVNIYGCFLEMVVVSPCRNIRHSTFPCDTISTLATQNTEPV